MKENICSKCKKPLKLPIENNWFLCKLGTLCDTQEGIATQKAYLCESCSNKLFNELV